MANNYSQVMCEDALPGTKADADAIEAVLVAAADNDVYHGFTFDHDGEACYLFADESGDWDQLPAEALALIGALITKAGAPYWEFGVAFTCSKMRPGNFGGTAFRIMPDGTIVNRVETWP